MATVNVETLNVVARDVARNVERNLVFSFMAAPRQRFVMTSKLVLTSYNHIPSLTQKPCHKLTLVNELDYKALIYLAL